jgi:hypothetical protein
LIVYFSLFSSEKMTIECRSNIWCHAFWSTSI